MKKTFKTPLILSALMLVMVSCSKKNDASPSSSSNFTIGATNYKSTTTVFTNNSLLSIDQTGTNQQTEIGIDFASRPSAGTYSVNATGSGLNGSNCTIEGSSTNGGMSVYSVGGGTVTIAVDGGKLKATFSNVPMGTINSNGNIQQSTTASGNLTEQ